MSGSRMQIALVAIAVAAVIAGVLVAAGGRAGHGHGYSRALPAREGALAPADLSAAARYLGLAPSELRLRMRGGQTLATIARATAGRSPEGLSAAVAAAKAARVHAALKAGRLSETATQAQLATVTARAHAELQRRHPAPGLGGALSPAASYLKMSRGELLRQVRAGRTLATIAARRKGRSVSGLIDALVAARSARIGAAVRLGALSSAEATELRGNLRRRMTALVKTGSTQGR